MKNSQKRTDRDVKPALSFRARCSAGGGAVPVLAPIAGGGVFWFKKTAGSERGTLKHPQGKAQTAAWRDIGCLRGLERPLMNEAAARYALILPHAAEKQEERDADRILRMVNCVFSVTFCLDGSACPEIEREDELMAYFPFLQTLRNYTASSRRRKVLL